MRARIVLPLVVVALAACGGGSTAPKQPDHFATINVSNNGFTPAADTVKTNTLVTWTVTSGDQSHVIRFTSNVPNGGNPNSNTIVSGQSASTTFLQTGSYSYDDSLHTSLTGTVVVIQ